MGPPRCASIGCAMIISPRWAKICVGIPKLGKAPRPQTFSFERKHSTFEFFNIPPACKLDCNFKCEPGNTTKFPLNGAWQSDNVTPINSENGLHFPTSSKEIKISISRLNTNMGGAILQSVTRNVWVLV